MVCAIVLMVDRDSQKKIQNKFLLRSAVNEINRVILPGHWHRTPVILLRPIYRRCNGLTGNIALNSSAYLLSDILTGKNFSSKKMGVHVCFCKTLINQRNCFVFRRFVVHSYALSSHSLLDKYVTFTSIGFNN